MSVTIAFITPSQLGSAVPDPELVSAVVEPPLVEEPSLEEEPLLVVEPSSVVAADVDESSGEPLEPSSPQAVTMSAQGTRVRARRRAESVIRIDP